MAGKGTVVRQRRRRKECPSKWGILREAESGF
jgi:hypothetical protein